MLYSIGPFVRSLRSVFYSLTLAPREVSPYWPLPGTLVCFCFRSLCPALLDSWIQKQECDAGGWPRGASQLSPQYKSS